MAGLPGRSSPSEVSDEERAFVAPHLALRPCTPQRRHGLREVFNALRHLIRPEAPPRMLPDDLPPCEIVHPQTNRRLEAGVFESMVHDLRAGVARACALRHHPGQPHPAVQARERVPRRPWWGRTQERLQAPGRGGPARALARGSRHAGPGQDRAPVATLAHAEQRCPGKAPRPSRPSP